MTNQAKSFWADTRAEWEDTQSGSKDNTAARGQDLPGLSAQPPGLLASALIAAINDPRGQASTARLKFLALSTADRVAVVRFLRSLS